MVTDTVVFGGLSLDPKREFYGAAHLYEIYTSLQFDRDWEKGQSRRMLSTRQRQIFTHAVAVAMYLSGKASVDYEGILELVHRGAAWLEGAGVAFDHRHAEQVATDVQVCTFLTREGNNFRLTHKSFMEFFVAQHFREAVERKRASPVLAWIIHGSGV